MRGRIENRFSREWEHTKYVLFGVLVIIASCDLQERELPANQRDILDTGIYNLEELEIEDQFCDPIFVENTDGCWSTSIDAYIDCHYQTLFSTFGGGWTGGDATYSITLPNGTRAWLFGDTFLGTVNQDGTRPGGIPLVNNTMVLERNNNLVTLHGGTVNNPEAFVKPSEAGTWYWPGDPTVYGDELHLLLSRMGSSGVGGMWDFGLRATDLAIYALPSMELISLEVKDALDDIYWGAAVMEDGDYTYIYGIRDAQINKYVHVARVADGDLTADWEYFNGSDWQDEPSDFVSKDQTSNQFSVFTMGGKYYLLTQKLGFGGELFLFESNEPYGPWVNRRSLYCTPENGGNIFTYNAFVHTELSDEQTLFITYNVNSFNFGDLFTDVNNYRPRFVRVNNWK